MITIEAVKKEYFRIEKLLKLEGINQSRYNANCKDGYSAYCIKRVLGLTYNGMKEQIGAKKASTLRPAHTYYQNTGKIICIRNGEKINKSACILDCNSKCKVCPDRQEDNIKATESLSEEQEALMRHEGIRGAGYSEMIEPHAER